MGVRQGLCPQAGFLFHAELLLLVNDYEPKVVVLHILSKAGVRADDHICRPVPDTLKDGLSLLPLSRVFGRPDKGCADEPQFTAPGEDLGCVLGCEHCLRGHDGGLPAVRRREYGEGARHGRFSAADITFDHGFHPLLFRCKAGQVTDDLLLSAPCTVRGRGSFRREGCQREGKG